MSITMAHRSGSPLAASSLSAWPIDAGASVAGHSRKPNEA